LCLSFAFIQANSMIDSTDVLVCSYTEDDKLINNVVYETIPEDAVGSVTTDCLDITTASFPLEIIPSKDGAFVNGVSTFDLVITMKHILGNQLLDSPYKIIAADVNRDGKISVMDLIFLRQLILGQVITFPNSDPWIFVNADYEFSDPTNPFPELENAMNMILQNIPEDPASFIGIKVGDLNNSVN